MSKLTGRNARTATLALVVLAFLAGPAAASPFTPTADSYVDASRPTSNFGTRTSIKVDGSPAVTGYLKFTVSGVGSAPSAQLRLFAETSHSVGVQVQSVADTTWTETGLTAANAPQVGAVLDSTGPLKSGTWYSLDVSGLVTGDGTYSLALTTTSSTSARLSAREGANDPLLLVPAPTPATSFTISGSGSTYTATSDLGSTFTGSVKFVVESAVLELEAGGGGTVTFTAGVFDQGTQRFELDAVHDIVFEGQGVDQTFIVNATSEAADTEVFDFSGADRITIRNMTISAGGPARTTSDAIDFDRGNDSLVENVKITGSRGRGIVFDGKNAGWTAVRNVIRNCQILGVPSDGIELLASSANRIEGCTISNVGGHGIQLTKSSTVADQPNKKSNDNVVTGNVIDNSGQDGINVNSSDRNQISNNTVTNSSNVTSGRDGIRIGSADSISCNNNTVAGNIATDNQPVKTQRYGLNIASALCSATTVGPGNDFAGNLTGAIRNLGTGTIFVP